MYLIILNALYAFEGVPMVRTTALLFMLIAELQRPTPCQSSTAVRPGPSQDTNPSAILAHGSKQASTSGACESGAWRRPWAAIPLTRFVSVSTRRFALMQRCRLFLCLSRERALSAVWFHQPAGCQLAGPLAVPLRRVSGVSKGRVLVLQANWRRRFCGKGQPSVSMAAKINARQGGRPNLNHTGLQA